MRLSRAADLGSPQLRTTVGLTNGGSLPIKHRSRIICLVEAGKPFCFPTVYPNNFKKLSSNLSKSPPPLPSLTSVLGHLNASSTESLSMRHCHSFSTNSITEMCIFLRSVCSLDNCSTLFFHKPSSRSFVNSGNFFRMFMSDAFKLSLVTLAEV